MVNKIIIVRSGDIIQAVYANHDTEVEVLDQDELDRIERYLPGISTIEEKELTRYRKLRDRINAGKAAGTIKEVYGGEL